MGNNQEQSQVGPITTGPFAALTFPRFTKLTKAIEFADAVKYFDDKEAQ